MDRWVGKVAVVTGASAGIGLAIAQALVKEGMIVIGLARRKSKMEAGMKDVKGKGKFYAVQCDVANEQEVIQTFEWLKKNIGTVHVLINNAGVIKIASSIADTETEELNRIMNINVMGLIHCSRQAIKLMNNGGHDAYIINISSVLGLPNIVAAEVPINIYTATKRAVTGLSETFRAELKGGKIRVANISPGYVKTELVGNIDPKLIQHRPALQSEDIAQSVTYILSCPTRVEIVELTVRPHGERV